LVERGHQVQELSDLSTFRSRRLRGVDEDLVTGQRMALAERERGVEMAGLQEHERVLDHAAASVSRSGGRW
jgi:hypothetical protein